jgi:hypothetical protein
MVTPNTTNLPYPIPANLNQWAQDMEYADNLPSSDTAALEAWGAAEGGSFHNIDYGNVLGTTLKEPGSAGTNGPGVQNYAASGQTQQQAWVEGIDATSSMWQQSNMADIWASLTGGNASATLPAALMKDPWGTNGKSVASILGENPDTIAALGSATSGGGTTSGGSGVVLPQATDTSLSSALGGTALGFFGLKGGSGKSYIVRGVFGILGVILLIIALKELTSDSGAIDTVSNVPTAAAKSVGRGIKKGTEAGAAAAVA